MVSFDRGKVIYFICMRFNNMSHEALVLHTSLYTQQNPVPFFSRCLNKIYTKIFSITLNRFLLSSYDAAATFIIHLVLRPTKLK